MGRSEPDKENTRTKGHGQKAIWTKDTDLTLLETLRTAKENGLQTDNGHFRSPVWHECAKKLAGTELQTNGPKKTEKMCQDRYGNMKKDFSQVDSLLNKSGFGWDNEKGVVTATDAVWNDLAQKNRSLVTRWRSREFPYYEAMHTLINGAIATGTGVFRPGKDFTPAQCTRRKERCDCNSDT